MGTFHKDRRLKIRFAGRVLAIGFSWELDCWGVWLYGPVGPRRVNGNLRDQRCLFGINRLRRV